MAWAARSGTGIVVASDGVKLPQALKGYASPASRYPCPIAWSCAVRHWSSGLPLNRGPPFLEHADDSNYGSRDCTDYSEQDK